MIPAYLIGLAFFVYAYAEGAKMHGGGGLPFSKIIVMLIAWPITIPVMIALKLMGGAR